MRKRIVLLIALALTFTSVLGVTGFDAKNAIAAPQFQKVNFSSAVVTADVLNVREGAGTNYKVVCTLKKGQQVSVFGKLGDWWAVYEPKMGCVGAASGKFLKPVGAAATPNTTGMMKTPQLPSTNPPNTQKPDSKPAGITADEQLLLDLVNNARAKAGAGKLAFDLGVVKCAREKAKDMVRNNYFSHQSPTYGSPFDMMKQYGVQFKAAGENIAGNQTVEGAFKAWMNSEGHKKNILNGNFNYCGFGIEPSKTYGKVLVQQFIRK